MEIVEITKDNIATVGELAVKIHAEDQSRTQLNQEGMERNIRKFLGKLNSIGIAITEKKRIIAFLMAYEYKETDIKNQEGSAIIKEILEQQRVIYIQDISVAADHRGKGIGQKLLQELEKKSKEKSIDAIALLTHPDNKPAIMLYEKFGFKRLQGTDRNVSYWLYKIPCL